jgi:hypothetical protein
MDVCIFSVCVVLFRLQPCDGLILHRRSSTDCIRSRNWSETKHFTVALCSRGSKKKCEWMISTRTTLEKQLFSRYTDKDICPATNIRLWSHNYFHIVLLFISCVQRNTKLQGLLDLNIFRVISLDKIRSSLLKTRKALTHISETGIKASRGPQNQLMGRMRREYRLLDRPTLNF